MLEELGATKLAGIAAVTVLTIYLVRKFLFTNDGNKAVKPTKTTTSTVLSKDEFRQFKLTSVETLTSGALVKCPVKKYRFALPKDSDSLGLPIGQHIRIRALIDNEEILRSYTPTSTNDDKGYFDLVIKIYPTGKMTQYFERLQVGDAIDVMGPLGRFTYQKNQFKSIAMIAGGTGITPMLQIITEVLKDKEDHTQLVLLFGNITEEDIILREKIDELAAKHDNFTVYHVLNEPPQNWTQGKGFITSAVIKEHFPQPSDDIKILLCGPPPMIKAMKDNLTDSEKGLGYSQASIFTF